MYLLWIFTLVVTVYELPVNFNTRFINLFIIYYPVRPCLNQLNRRDPDVLRV